MVPAISTGGRSFKAAASYFLHDRLPDGRGQADTAGRVPWTLTLNLPTDDPERAWRMMADTARNQVALKRASGGSATGRKLERPTFAFSLAWHPDERPGKEEQSEAVRSVLAALGLAEHQALVIAHDDTAHAHVHVLVNRVHPTTGRAAPLSKSKLALSQWAQAYEERHGRVFCAARVENNARRDGTRPGRAAANRSRRAPRQEWQAGGRDRAETAALRQHHAALFSEQAGLERQGDHGRRDEAARFQAGRSASRKACTDRQHHQATMAAHPALAEAEARTVALLASDRPADALAALTRDRSTFTRKELERFVGRHTPDTATFATTMARLDAAPELVRAGKDARQRVRFTTRAHQALERRMADTATALHRTPHGQGGKSGDVAARFKGWRLSPDQTRALHHVLAAPRLAVVSGVAGTGKSTMLDAARQSWEEAGLRVQGLALAAEAAHGLTTGSGIKVAGTIHSRLYLWEQGRNLPGPKDILVVDEAGMVGSRQMERLLHFAQAGGAKIVLVGDARQLQAIEAGGAFRAIGDRVGDVAIKTVRRQKADWQKDATSELAAGHIGIALDRYEAAGMLHGHATGAEAKAALIAAWNAQRREQPGRTQLVMAFLRRDVADLNARARACLRADGRLGADVVLTTASGPQAFAVNDRIGFLRNDTSMGVRNGSLGTVEAIQGRAVTVRLDGEPARRITFGLDLYDHIAHGYAATIHKSQGATVDRAHLYCSPNLDQHAAYVAMTRHRDRLDLHWSRDTIPTRARLTAILSRLAMKDTTLDYAEDRAHEHQARHDASDAMRDRVRRRAAAFAERETTKHGRAANARSLLPAGATGMQIARLSLDAPERARLFRHRQSVLRQWAHRIVPAPLPVPLPIVRPTPGATIAALRAHDRQTLDLWHAMQARHGAQRVAERDSRSALQRSAAASWQAERIRASAVAFLAKWSGYLAQAWRATHPDTANDNTPGHNPPRMGPRLVPRPR